MKAFILSAGLGKRLRPYTDHVPKPLVPFKDRPLIAYTLDNLVYAGVGHIGFNAHYLADQLLTYMETWGQQHPKIVLYPSDERHLLLDTGGALTKALSLFSYPKAFLALNSDTFWHGNGQDVIGAMIDAFDAQKMDVLLGIVPLSHMAGYSGQGDFGDRVFTGMQIISASLLLTAGLNQPFSVHRLWSHAQQRDRFQTLSLSADFVHVGDAHWYRTRGMS